MDEQFQLGDSEELIALKRAWPDVLNKLSAQVNRPVLEGFFRTAKPIAINDNTATIGAASELAKIFLDKQAELISATLGNILGKPIKVEFIVDAGRSRGRTAQRSSREQVGGIVKPISLPLNERYTFESFVTGPSNKLAYAAAKTVGEKPGETYNPFFIYGGPGLGKTHLLHAIAHLALGLHPHLKIAYVSCEAFTSQYVAAICDHRAEEFRRQYRNIDLWLVDDIHFLIGKERTKEEFFHTFNALYQTNKQIVVSSDRPPREFNPLEERLRSHLESGLVVDIAPPDLETRIAILQRQAEAEQADIPMPVLEHVANLITANVRALNGALVTLMAYNSLMKTPLTPKLAEEVLARYLTEKRRTEITPDAVLRMVAREFGLSVPEIISATRRKDITLARHVAMHLCRTLTSEPLTNIGKVFGGRDHSTVLHASRRIEALSSTEPKIREVLERISSHLRSGYV